MLIHEVSSVREIVERIVGEADEILNRFADAEQ